MGRPNERTALVYSRRPGAPHGAGPRAGDGTLYETSLTGAGGASGRPGGSADDRVVIIGAGPAGLTAAWELSRLGIPATVFEADDIVGGIARTGSHHGYRYDIGGHRFFTKVSFVEDIWREILGDDLLERPRLSRIYYRGKFFDYPLRPANALFGLGPIEAARCMLSFAKARVTPHPEEINLEQWVCNRFGRRLYEIFFKTYTEKVWGMPCTEIGADWAAQRIKNLDLLKAVRNALLGGRGGGGGGGGAKGEVITTLIDAFLYPRLGPGQMWERCTELLAQRGYETRMKSPVVRIRHDGARVTGVEVRGPDGEVRFEPGAHVISSMPMRDLVRALDPAPPADVRAAAERLRYRDFLTVVLVVDAPELFPDNWIYIHSADVKLGRIQNFKNWSPEMVPDPSRTALGLEYFVQEGDEVWSMADADLVALGGRECGVLGLVDPAKVVDGCVVRMPKAYPVYDAGYKEAVATIRAYLETLPNLQLIGRYGQHRYNNQDHSMATAVYAARNVAGADYDVFAVNEEAEYHEELREKPKKAAAPVEVGVPVGAMAGAGAGAAVTVGAGAMVGAGAGAMAGAGAGLGSAAGAGVPAGAGSVPSPALAASPAVPAPAAARVTGRAVPMPVSASRSEVDPAEEYARMVREAFARFDPVALGTAVGSIAGVGLFLATLVLLLRGGKVVGPMLSLLGNYIIGYKVTWAGAFVGLFETAIFGFVFGYLLAQVINLAIGFHESNFLRRAEAARILE